MLPGSSPSVPARPELNRRLLELAKCRVLGQTGEVERLAATIAAV
jgi:hypothetical protein